MHVEVTPVSAAELSAAAPGESSAAIRARSCGRGRCRPRGSAVRRGVHTNAMMNAAMLREYCCPDAASAALLERAMERLRTFRRGLTTVF